MSDIYIGQELVCLNGEKVTINQITEDEIIVEYKYKLHRRPKDIIGRKLFVEKDPFDIYIGQKLVRYDGIKVIVKEVREKDIIIIFENNYYLQNKDMVHILYTAETTVEPTSSNNEDTIKQYKCKDCMVLRRGDCWGDQQLCNYFVASPTISRREWENWPAYGDATYFRLKNGK